MNRKLALATLLSLALLLFTVWLYSPAGPLHMRTVAECLGHADGEQEQVACDGYLNAGMVWALSVPLTGCVFAWAAVGMKHLLAVWECVGNPWLWDPAHYVVAKGCEICKPMRVMDVRA